MKNKSQRKILNHRGPNVDHCGTPNKISSQKLRSEFTLVLCMRKELYFINTFLSAMKNSKADATGNSKSRATENC